MMVPDQLASIIKALKGPKSLKSEDNNELPPEASHPMDTWNTPVVPSGSMPAYGPRGM